MNEIRHKTGHFACTNLPKIVLKGKELIFRKTYWFDFLYLCA